MKKIREGKMFEYIMALILIIAADVGVPPYFALAVAVEENSTLDPATISAVNADGSVDLGVMQLNSKYYGHIAWSDPETNIRTGCMRLKELIRHKELNTYWGVAVAYNCGFARYISKQGPPSSSIEFGSSIDMFARDIPVEWDLRVLDHAKLFENKYLFQTKNVMRITTVLGKSNFPYNSILCTTIESNRYREMFYKNCPSIRDRMKHLLSWQGERWITIEPIMDFDISILTEMIREANPTQVNIGADSGRNGLPEPSKKKIEALIKILEKFTKVHQKKNLRRLTNG